MSGTGLFSGRFPFVAWEPNWKSNWFHQMVDIDYKLYKWESSFGVTKKWEMD